MPFYEDLWVFSSNTLCNSTEWNISRNHTIKSVRWQQHQSHIMTTAIACFKPDILLLQRFFVDVSLRLKLLTAVSDIIWSVNDLVYFYIFLEACKDRLLQCFQCDRPRTARLQKCRCVWIWVHQRPVCAPPTGSVFDDDVTGGVAPPGGRVSDYCSQ